MRIVRRAARAILIDDDGRLVVFKRTVPKRKVYWSTPGGGVDAEDTSVEAALHRELAEELGAVVDRTQQVFLASPPRGDGIAIQHFFVCHLVSMNLSARTGSEFSNPAKGRYDVERIDLRGKKLARYDLQPRQARDFILANRDALLAAALDDGAPPLTAPAPAPATAAAATSAAESAGPADLVEPETAVIVGDDTKAPVAASANLAELAAGLAEPATAEAEAPAGEVVAPEVSAGTPSGPMRPVPHVAVPVPDVAPAVPGDGAPTTAPGDAVIAGAGARRVVRIAEQRTAPRGPRRPASQLLEVVATPTGSSPSDGSSAQTTTKQGIPRQPQRRSIFRRRRR